MYNKEASDDEVFANGVAVAVIGNKSSKWVEKFVVDLRKYTGQRVDWSWMAGRAVVRALGDIDSVRKRVRYFSCNFLMVVEEDGTWTNK